VHPTHQFRALLRVLLTAGALALSAALTSCSNLDSVAPKWDQLSIGSSRDVAISLLGPPDTRQAIDLPIASADLFAWSAPIFPKSRTYIAVMVGGRVIAKSIIQ
jgi:hypothetical protein